MILLVSSIFDSPPRRQQHIFRELLRVSSLVMGEQSLLALRDIAGHLVSSANEVLRVIQLRLQLFDVRPQVLHLARDQLAVSQLSRRRVLPLL